MTLKLWTPLWTLWTTVRTNSGKWRVSRVVLSLDTLDNRENKLWTKNSGLWTHTLEGCVRVQARTYTHEAALRG